MKKNFNRVYKKNTFLWFLDFLGEKLILDYVINTKSQVLPAIFFFRKNLYSSTKQSLQPKKVLKFFTSNFHICL